MGSGDVRLRAGSPEVARGCKKQTYKIALTKEEKIINKHDDGKMKEMG